jgi:hypothetical protein
MSFVVMQVATKANWRRLEAGNKKITVKFIDKMC